LKDVVSNWDFFRDSELKHGFDWPQPHDDDPDPAIKRVYWNRLRVPLTDNQNGNYVFLDLDPSERGTIGQLIFLQRLQGPLEKLADRLDLWLDRFAEDLETGRYLYDADAESLIPEDQW